ncbi:MAG: arylesterase [Oceanobacter sp.]
MKAELSNLLQRTNSFKQIVLLLLLLIPFSSQANQPPTVLVLGDSISAGFGIPVQRGWVNLLQNKLQGPIPDVKVINASVSGETTSGGLSRLPALLDQHQPDLLIIELGGNDALRGTPLKIIRRNLESMIDKAEHLGVMVMLLGMQLPPNYGPVYNTGFSGMYESLSLERDTLVVPFLLEGIATEPGMMQSDGIHPTVPAQPLMADMVFEAMDIWVEFTTML